MSRYDRQLRAEAVELERLIASGYISITEVPIDLPPELDPAVVYDVTERRVEYSDSDFPTASFTFQTPPPPPAPRKRRRSIEI